MTRKSHDEKISDLQIRMNQVWDGVGLAGYVYDGQFRAALDRTIRDAIHEDRLARSLAFWKAFFFYLPWAVLVIGGTVAILVLF